MIAGIIGVGIFMIGHLGGAIWFASRVNQQMKAFEKNLAELSADIKAMFQRDTRIAVLESRVAGLEARLQTVRLRPLPVRFEDTES